MSKTSNKKSKRLVNTFINRRILKTIPKVISSKELPNPDKWDYGDN